LAIEEEIVMSIPISKYRAQINTVILDLIEDNPVNDSNTANDSTNPIPNPTLNNSTEDTATNPVDGTLNTPLLTEILNQHIGGDTPQISIYTGKWYTSWLVNGKLQARAARKREIIV
jgi:hypothetical protein